jgi:hypothetical protein
MCITQALSYLIVCRQTYYREKDKNLFRVALHSYLLNHSFYSVNEFIEGAWIAQSV